MVAWGLSLRNIVLSVKIKKKTEEKSVVREQKQTIDFCIKLYRESSIDTVSSKKEQISLCNFFIACFIEKKQFFLIKKNFSRTSIFSENKKNSIL